MDTPYSVKKIKDGFWSIEERGVFAYLIEGSEKAMLVDTGFGGGDLLELVKSLTKKPFFVVITHADPDHVLGVKFFSEVYIHPSEFDRYSQKGEGNVKALPVWEGHVFDLGDKKFEVILIPGHTPGSIALFDRVDGTMFCGDSFQYGAIFMCGPGRNLEAFEASINKVIKIKDSIKEIYPGHHNYPVSNEIFKDLLEGLAIYKTGTVEGKDPGRPMPGKLYVCGKVNFLI